MEQDSTQTAAPAQTTEAEPAQDEVMLVDSGDERTPGDDDDPEQEGYGYGEGVWQEEGKEEEEPERDEEVDPDDGDAPWDDGEGPWDDGESPWDHGDEPGDDGDGPGDDQPPPDRSLAGKRAVLKPGPRPSSSVVARPSSSLGAAAVPPIPMPGASSQSATFNIGSASFEGLTGSKGKG